MRSSSPKRSAPAESRSRSSQKNSPRSCSASIRLASSSPRPRTTFFYYLALGVTEILEYGSTSTQVTRRLRTLLESLLGSVTAEQSGVAPLEVLVDHDLGRPVVLA